MSNHLFSQLNPLSFTFRLQLISSWVIALTLAMCGSARAEFAEKAAERMKHSTVRVVILEGTEVKGHGTGFIISNQGHVATNYHVIEGAEEAVILYCEGDRLYLRPAELIGFSGKADLAILKIDPIPSTQVVEIATCELLAGQTVLTVGFPGILDAGTWATLEGVELSAKPGEGRITSAEALGDFIPSVFPGAVAKTLTMDKTRWVMHSAKISPGNSGGPLIDTEGRVCGINTQFAPSSVAGSDYPMSIQSSELVALARAHSIPINVTASRATNRSGDSRLMMLLWVAVAAFALVMFLIVLRKPRMVIVDAVSKLVHSKHQPTAQANYRANILATPQPRGSISTPGMRLRGRDLHGLSYDIAFTDADFQLSGGKLVIGRDNDLSKLHLSHDSVSRQHAKLTSRGGVIYVEDRNSGNGTKLNGRELAVGAPPVPLQAGDKLTLGEVDLMFEITR